MASRQSVVALARDLSTGEPPARGSVLDRSEGWVVIPIPRAGRDDHVTRIGQPNELLLVEAALGIQRAVVRPTQDITIEWLAFALETLPNPAVGVSTDEK